MSDYIKREDAIFVALQQPLYSVVSQIKQLEGINLDDYVPKDFHDKTCEAMAKRHQEEIADILERADADRPQGEWKSVKASIYPYGYDVECSVCGHRMGSSFGYKFCPMCGAQMKGADDE